MAISLGFTSAGVEVLAVGEGCLTNPGDAAGAWPSDGNEKPKPSSDGMETQRKDQRDPAQGTEPTYSLVCEPCFQS